MYKVTFKQGLAAPIEVEAKDEIEAKKKGLEYYRYNLTYMSFRTFDQVIEKVEESADWGESIVSSTTKKNREWVVTGSSKFPYELSEDSNDLTPEELKSAIQDRELYWAEVKKRNDEYLASKQTASSDNKFTFGSF